MEKILDLPAHPLFVHAPVVLAPLVCLAAIALAVRPGWRRPYRWHLVVATALVAIATQLAIGSGEAFDEALDGAAPIDEHADLAETTRLWLIGWLLLGVGAAAHGRWVADRAAGDERSVNVQHALAGLAAILGIVATIWMFRTGHEGAQIVWQNTLPDS